MSVRTNPLIPAPRVWHVAGCRVGLLPTLVGALCFGTLSGTLACHDLSGLAGKQDLPAGVSDPNAVHTSSGALQMYTAAVYLFLPSANSSRGTGTSGGELVRYVLGSGVFTDELQAGNLGGNVLQITSATGIDSSDARQFMEDGTDYTLLNQVRGAANQAIGALTAYYPDASPALRGHLYALEAYAEIFLADFYCSGVPLSTLDFNGDFTYRPGSSTQQVYEHALALLDTAVALSTDSVRILNLAQVGKGRVLLALGHYAEAAQAVASVPTSYQYSVYVDWSKGSTAVTGSEFAMVGSSSSCTTCGVTVADYDGGNGLPYVSGGDARSLSVTARNNAFGVPQYTPMKYGATKPALAPIVLASGVEARLIEAEAALQAGSPTWLSILNTLRTDGTVVRTYTRLCHNGIRVGTTVTQEGSPCPSSQTPQNVVDTTWGPGTGIGLIPAAVQADTAPVCPTSTGAGTACTDTVWYKGLRPLTDPGSVMARVNLLFQERAYWLFLTGERQGDLRRLVRNYGRDPETVYPTGPYPLSGVLPSYGGAVSANIPKDEFQNPKFTGCLSRGA